MIVDPRRPNEIAKDPLVVQTLWLIKNGIPFDVAWLLPLEQAKAWAIVFGEFEGGKYDWDLNEWQDRNGG